MSRLAGGLLPHKQMPSRRSKNVVQVTANLAKSETKSEKIGEKRFASFCHKLPFSSWLRRLRQDLVNLVPRLEGRRSIRLSYGRSRFIDSKPFVLRVETFLGALTLCSKGRRYNQLNYGHTAQLLSSSTYSELFKCSTFNSRSIRPRWGSFGRNLKAQSDPRDLILAKFHVLCNCSQSLRHHHLW